jgi:hypothetical protein
VSRIVTVDMCTSLHTGARRAAVSHAFLAARVLLRDDA